MAEKKKGKKGAGATASGNGGAPEQPKGGNGGPTPAEIPEDAEIFDEMSAPVLVQAQYLKDLSFESPGAPETLAAMGNQPDINIEVNVEAQKLGDNDFEVTLHLNVNAEENGRPMFIVECQYAGLFTLNEVPEEAIQPIILIEAPRLLFPFARNIVADATREGGFPPLLIQPVDFVGLYQQHVEQEGGAPVPIEQS